MLAIYFTFIDEESNKSKFESLYYCYRKQMMMVALSIVHNEADGEYTYKNIDDLIEYCAEHMANENFSSENVRAYMKDMLPKLNY